MTEKGGERYLPEYSKWVATGDGVTTPLGSWFRSGDSENDARNMNYAFREGVLTGKALNEKALTPDELERIESIENNKAVAFPRVTVEFLLSLVKRLSGEGKL